MMNYQGSYCALITPFKLKDFRLTDYDLPEVPPGASQRR